MTPYYADDHLTLYGGDCRDVLRELPAESVHTVVTSPPYWGLRDYGVGGQLGLEPTPEAYVENMVAVFREVRRVLRADGTLWLNLGDSYASKPAGVDGVSRSSGLNGIGSANYQASLRRSVGTKRSTLVEGLPEKNLVGIPWRVAFALQADGWYLRSDIIWAKPNPMPESVTDRPTKAHEYLFLLSKSARYYYDADAVREENSPLTLERHAGRPVRTYDDARTAGRHGHRPHEGTLNVNGDRHTHGRNLRSVWTIATEPYPGAHFATFPRKLVEPCVKAGCPTDGTVLDPFAGSGTTLLVAQALGRRAIGIDLNPDYLRQALARNAQAPLGLTG